MSVAFDITDHAVERYVKRHAPGSTMAQARQYLESLLLDAKPVKERSLNGDPMWRTDDPVTVFIVKPDGRKQVVVTVLPAGAYEDAADIYEREIGPEDEVVAAYKRIRPLLEKGGGSNGNAKTEVNNLRQQLAAQEIKFARRLKSLEDQLAAEKKKTKPESAGLVKNLTLQVAAKEDKYRRQIIHSERMKEERNLFLRAYRLAIAGEVDQAKAVAAKVQWQSQHRTSEEEE